MEKGKESPRGFHKGPIPAEKRDRTPTHTHTTQEIGTSGGTISLPDAGLSIHIPAGALSRNHRFDVAAHRSVFGFTVNMVPHADLAERAVVRQDVTDAVKDKGELFVCCSNMVDDHAVVESIHSTEVEGNTVIAKLPHFSGYVVACGILMQPCNPEQDGPECVWVD